MKDEVITPSVTVYGSMHSPVYGWTYDPAIMNIEQNHLNPFIIATDACVVTPLESTGLIHISDEPVIPGAGEGNPEPPIGDVTISGGIGFDDYPIYVDDSYRTEYFKWVDEEVDKVFEYRIIRKMADIVSDSLVYCLFGKDDV